MLCQLTLGEGPRPETSIPIVSRLSHWDFPATPELDNKLCTGGIYMLWMVDGASSGKICLMIFLSSAYT